VQTKLSGWYLFLLLVIGLQFPVFAETADPQAESRTETQTDNLPPGYVFGVTVSSAQELEVILNRADSLRELFDPDQHGRIAIVLHGEELQLFQKDNYSANQSIVERARLLDKEKVIDIKACQTKMRFLEIEQNELPGFIEQVPFAPVEIERLEKEHDFTRL
jgi:intracellular sulfur oxidation DsrE/DsrF family protein